MAVSRNSSNGPDWKDIAGMLVAFQSLNTCSISIEMRAEPTGNGPDLFVRAMAWEKSADRRVVKPLASVSVQWSREQFRTLEGLATYLLYQLDFQLASHEWENVNKKA